MNMNITNINKKITFDMPIIFKNKNNDQININSISNFYIEHKSNLEDFFIWDRNGWTNILNVKKEFNNFPIKYIIAKNAAVATSFSSKLPLKNGTNKLVSNIVIGDNLNLMNNFPKNEKSYNLTEFEAEMIGYIVGDGNVRKNKISITSKHKEELYKFENYWSSKNISCKFSIAKSGFCDNKIHRLDAHNKNWVETFVSDIYTIDKFKKVPEIILNSNSNIKKAFLKGYNDADGLKKNQCTYEFKNFTTNSTVLSLGLILLIKEITNQNFCINIEKTNKWGYNSFYYKINFQSDNTNNVEKYKKVILEINKNKSQRKISNETGISRSFIRKISKGYIPNNFHHLQIKDFVVKKELYNEEYCKELYTIITQSGTFHCGIGFIYL